MMICDVYIFHACVLHERQIVRGILTLSTGELLSDPFAIKNWKFNEFFQIFLGLTYMIT